MHMFMNKDFKGNQLLMYLFLLCIMRKHTVSVAKQPEICLANQRGIIFIPNRTTGITFLKCSFQNTVIVPMNISVIKPLLLTVNTPCLLCIARNHIYQLTKKITCHWFPGSILHSSAFAPEVSVLAGCDKWKMKKKREVWSLQSYSNKQLITSYGSSYLYFPGQLMNGC